MRHLFLLVFCGLLAISCASTSSGPQELVPREDRYFLVSPLTDYPLSVGSTTERRLTESFGELLAEGNRRGAEELAAELLDRNPDLAPAAVLRAQADFIGGDHAQVLARLEPIVEQYGEYVAAQLVYGRSSEKVGNLVVALEAYQRIAGTNQLAQSRVVDLEPRAVEIMALRIEDALSKGLTAEAEAGLEELQSFAPQEERTL